MDHPARQTPTIRSAGYGSIGRSSPKVSHRPLARNQRPAAVTDGVVPAVQSTSVRGEDLHHAHQVPPLHVAHGGSDPSGLHLRR